MTTTRSFRLTASIAAASIALVTVASIAAAAGPNGNGNGPNGNGNGPGAGTGTCAATCPNGGQPATLRQGAQHRGQGMVNQAQGARRGTGRQVPVTPAVLTADQRAMVAYMVEEEKLAHDLYVTLDGILGVPEMARIAQSETRHMAAVQTLLSRYGIVDPTLGLAVGAFSTSEFQGLYDTLLAQGRVSLAAAYDVGEIVERDDIAELGRASAGVTAQDVQRVYANLLAGSERHLAAFQAL